MKVKWNFFVNIVLKPIVLALDQVQGEQFLFYCYAIPVLRQTETLLKTIQEQSLKSNAPLVQTVLRGMQKRFQPYLQQDFMVVKDALLATISHPYFKLKPILKEKRDALKQELIDTANKLSSNVSEGFNTRITAFLTYLEFPRAVKMTVCPIKNKMRDN